MKRLFVSAVLILACASLAVGASVKRELSESPSQGPASSGPTKTGDITVDSKVGKVTNVGAGQGVQSKADVHSVDVKGGSKTGDISVKGKAGSVTNVGVGQGVKSESSVGSVKTGGY